MPCSLNKLLRAFQIEITFGAHSADDSSAPHRYVAVFVREQNRGADALIAAAGRIRAVNSGEHRYSEFLKLRMPKKRCSAASAIRIHLLLLGQLNPRAVDEPYQRNVKAFCNISDSENVFRLAGNPRAGQHFVIEADNYGPFPSNFA